MHWKEHSITIDEYNYKVFDTVGMQEPQLDNDAYLDSIADAYDLIAKLTSEGCIDLLLFCVQICRPTATVRTRRFQSFLLSLASKERQIWKIGGPEITTSSADGASMSQVMRALPQSKDRSIKNWFVWSVSLSPNMLTVYGGPKHMGVLNRNRGYSCLWIFSSLPGKSRVRCLSLPNIVVYHQKSWLRELGPRQNRSSFFLVEAMHCAIAVIGYHSRS